MGLYPIVFVSQSNQPTIIIKTVNIKNEEWEGFIFCFHGVQSEFQVRLEHVQDTDDLAINGLNKATLGYLSSDLIVQHLI